MEGWVKIKAAADYAGVSERNLCNWLKQGLKHSRMRSNCILIKYEYIDDYLETFTVDEGENLNDIVDQVMEEL